MNGARWGTLQEEKKEEEARCPFFYAALIFIPIDAFSSARSRTNEE